MLDDLTRDSYTLLAVLYKEYLAKRENGADITTARLCGGAEHIRNTLMEMETVQDVADWCFELESNGYLTISNGSNTVYLSALTSKAISDMEKRHGRKIKDILDLISKFIP